MKTTYERGLRRGWWKPWDWSTRTWILVCVVWFVFAPFVVRWICLWRVPDVAIPFSIEIASTEDLDQHQQARSAYLRAARLFDQIPFESISEGESFADFDEVHAVIRAARKAPDGQWDDRVNRWLITRQDAFREFCRLGSLDRFERRMRRGPSPDLDLDFSSALRELGSNCAIEAMRLQRSGEVDAAWQCYLAILRAARCGDRTTEYGDYLTAVCVREIAFDGIATWAERRQVAGDQLQIVRDELAIDHANRIMPSELLKTKYASYEWYFSRSDSAVLYLPSWPAGFEFDEQLIGIKSFLVWTIGQPEITRRVARQIVVNNIQAIDLPRHRRGEEIHVANEILFSYQTSTNLLLGQLPPTQLAALLKAGLSTVPGISTEHLLFSESIDLIHREESARRSTLDVCLASHQFQRRYGKFPESIEELIPEFLDQVPFDPMEASGAPLRYRRNESGAAIVWSIGRNNSDDGGSNAGDIAVHIRLDQYSPTTSLP